MTTSSLYVSETKNHHTRQKSLNRMDAIACGVQARFEERTGYSRMIIETTINVAKALGVPESEIQNWANTRLSRVTDVSERLQEIKSVLDRLHIDSLGITV